ncbi:MAG: DNA polymerase III subunit beta [Desulfurella sp.]|uniref:DNA polymerase III subunit beta n=1 Tax=Desulfurella sp. TaxID=1962857 RepID=UPI003C8DC792
MQFSIDANTIKKLVSNVSGGLSKDKNSILSNYMVSIKDNTISITSLNEVVQINTFSPIESEGDCEFLAKPDLFDRLKVLSGDIIFKLEDNILTIKNGSYKTTTKIFQSEGYSVESIEDYKIAGVFDSNDILELLKANIASSKEEQQTREFNGVLIEIEQKKANFVATNRSRLFWISKPIDNDISFYCIAEKDSVLQLSRILKANDRVTLLYKIDGENITKIAFQSSNCTIVSKTINGKFPQYQAVTLEEAQNVQCIAFDKESLKTALQKVLTLSNDELAVVEFNIQENNAQLNVTNKEGEIASDIIDFISYNHTPIILTINGRYVIDFLNNIQSNSVYFYYKEAIKPIELKATSEHNVCYIYVMTPVR